MPLPFHVRSTGRTTVDASRVVVPRRLPWRHMRRGAAWAGGLAPADQALLRLQPHEHARADRAVALPPSKVTGGARARALEPSGRVTGADRDTCAGRSTTRAKPPAARR